MELDFLRENSLKQEYERLWTFHFYIRLHSSGDILSYQIRFGTGDLYRLCLRSDLFDSKHSESKLLAQSCSTQDEIHPKQKNGIDRKSFVEAKYASKQPTNKKYAVTAIFLRMQNVSIKSETTLTYARLFFHLKVIVFHPCNNLNCAPDFSIHSIAIHSVSNHRASSKINPLEYDGIDMCSCLLHW